MTWSQSGPSGSPSILNASPEAATGGYLAILKTGDRIRIDLNKHTANILISKAEYERRKKALAKQGGFKMPGSQTPWQEIQRGMVDELSNGMVLNVAAATLDDAFCEEIAVQSIVESNLIESRLISRL